MGVPSSKETPVLDQGYHLAIGALPLSSNASANFGLDCTVDHEAGDAEKVPKDRIVLKGNKSTVLYLAFADDGHRLIAGSGWEASHVFREVLTWDTDTWKLLTRSTLSDLAKKFANYPFFSPSYDHATVITQNDKGELHIRASTTAAVLLEIKRDQEKLFTGLSPDGRFALFGRFPTTNGFYCIDLASGLKMGPVLVTDCDYSWPLARTVNQRWIGWKCKDKTLRVFDIVALKLRCQTLSMADEGNQDKTRGGNLVLGDSGDFLAAWSNNSPLVHVYSLETGKERCCLTPYDKHLYADPPCLTFSADGRMLATASSGKFDVSIWEVATGKKRMQLKNHSLFVTALAFSPNCRLLASGADDTNVCVCFIDKIFKPVGEKLSLSNKNLERLWHDLGDPDAETAFRAISMLVAAPGQTTEFLREQVQPVERVDAGALKMAIKELNSASFSLRQKAKSKLLKCNELARHALETELSRKPALEMRLRIEEVLREINGPLTEPEVLRGLRAIETLEKIGTLDAQKILEKVGGGADGALVTEDAKKAIIRLKKL